MEDRSDIRMSSVRKYIRENEKILNFYIAGMENPGKRVYLIA